MGEKPGNNHTDQGQIKLLIKKERNGKQSEDQQIEPEFLQIGSEVAC